VTVQAQKFEKVSSQNLEIEAWVFNGKCAFQNSYDLQNVHQQ
jgi:hypothetical protein